MALGLPGSDPGVPDLDRDLTRLGRVILVCQVFASHAVCHYESTAHKGNRKCETVQLPPEALAASTRPSSRRGDE